MDIGKILAFYIVTALLFLNSILGFAEEQKASSAVEALKKRLQVNTRVLRDGAWKIVPARELVPGDIVRVRSGDFVPADVKIMLLYIGFNSFNFMADDQALTTFSFETLFYFAIFSIFVVRERGHFWNSIPSKTLLTAIIFDMIIATMISAVGIPGLKAIPLIENLSVIVYSFIFSLIVNDLIKFILVKKTEVKW